MLGLHYDGEQGTIFQAVEKAYEFLPAELTKRSH
jgi:hypothetical protein